MLGAMIGDIVGSPYEFSPIKTTEFPLFSRQSNFTDDTVCTVAIADWLLNGAGEDTADYLRKWCLNYPRRGYGGYYSRWVANSNIGPYDSWGNGSAMRVSAVGYFGQTKEEVLELAKLSAVPTHGHPDAVAGAQATALSIFRAIRKTPKQEILEEIREDFGYKLNRSVEDIRQNYTFYVDCKRTVPPAIICALEAESYEEAIRNAVSLGGDADTLAAIAGSIAEPLYLIPDDIMIEGLNLLPDDIRTLLIKFATRVSEIQS